MKYILILLLLCTTTVYADNKLADETTYTVSKETMKVVSYNNEVFNRIINEYSICECIVYTVDNKNSDTEWVIYVPIKYKDELIKLFDEPIVKH